MKVESREMEPITNTITALISKPVVGISAGGISGLALFLKWCGIITTLFGLVGAVVGGTIALFHGYYFFKRLWKTRHIKEVYVCANAEHCPIRKDLTEELDK